MSGSNVVVDIPTDWLYKGKRKSNRSSGSTGASTSSKLPPETIRPRRSRSASISNGALSSGSVTESSVPSSVEHKKEAVIPSKERSHVEKNVSSSRSRSLSITTSDLKRSDSLGERSKRSLFGSLFGKKPGSSSSSQTLIKEPNSPEVRPQTPVSVPSPDRIVLNKKSSNSSKNIPIQELSRVRLQRVHFAVDKFDSDPPQQLPSRKPKIGNVLVPDDMVSDTPPISQGITNTGSSSTSGSSSNSSVGNGEPLFTKDSKEYKLALEEYKKSLKESIKHQQEAHYAAQRIEHEVANFKHSAITQRSFSVPNTETDTRLDSKVANLSIDKPIHMHEYHFATQEQQTHVEVTLDVVYTRCCHLREILPIPSTLRQVKGKTAPLHTLKFLNPKPTLIDVLSFCDFISVVPINTVIFDKVALTPEMFKIVMTSLVNSQVLEKLSLRNVTIDEDGWKVLCKFLLINKSITKLDISQTKIKSDVPENLNRDNMDWSLFSQILKKRNGKPLEELLLNGIKFNRLPLESFQLLLNSFAETSSTIPLKLGVATSDINIDCVKYLLNWMSQNNVQGVDFAFNDLSSFVKPMVSKLSSLEFNHLEYFTLNSTSISNAYDLALILKYLAALPQLKFLDLSNLPQTFPDALPYMYKYLPRFLSLNRIHIDNNNLNFKEISMICSILSKCKSLTHVSMLAQGPLVQVIDDNDDEAQNLRRFAKNAFSATLYAFVRDSPNLVALDVDYETITDEIKSRIALMLMRNMNKTIDSNFHIDEASTQDDLLFDGSLIAETAEDILKRLEDTELMKADATKRYLTKKYFEKLQKVHHRVQTTIDEMFEKRSSGELPLQEKENLVRLLLLEKNLSNILDLFANIPHLSQVLGSSLLALPCLKHVGSETAISNPSSADHEVITRPHLMATDSGSIIDVITGKPLLREDSSATSTLGKRQEEEEGELHKWGFFVQQQRSLYPENESKPLSSSRVANEPIRTPSTSTSSTGDTKVSSPRILPKIPSGTELREAIIKAKGIDSIDDLIRNVNSDHVELDSIYGGSLRSGGSESESQKFSRDSKIDSPRLNARQGDSEANTDATVKQTYDKLLNNLKLERPKKSEVSSKLK